MKKPEKYQVSFPIDNLGKIPPQATELEEAVLGACMIEKEGIDICYHLLRPESFYKEVNQKIYSAIISLYAENSPIDILTVTEELRKQDQLDEVGGPWYITQLTSRVASAVHVEYHAQIIAQKYYQRELIRISSEVQHKSFDETIDVGELLEFLGSEYMGISDKIYGSSKQKTFKEQVNNSMDQYYRRRELYDRGEILGVRTPVSKLTRMTGGWQNTDLIILAGRPSMGKTAIMIASILAASEDNTDVAVFSLEMEDVRLVDRILVGIADVDMDRFKNGNLTDEELKKLEWAADLIHKRNIYIDDKSNPTPMYIKNRARILKKKSDAAGRKFIILTDYLQLMDSDTEAKTNRNREQEVATLSKQSKQTAKDLRCPYILIAQLSRSCESRNDKRPMLSDLRESGAIEQDADVVIFIYRDWYYGIKEDEEGNSTEGKGELNIAKHRNGGIGPVFFGHNKSLTRIFDYGNIPQETINYVENWLQKHENSKDDGPF